MDGVHEGQRDEGRKGDDVAEPLEVFEVAVGRAGDDGAGEGGGSAAGDLLQRSADGHESAGRRGSGTALMRACEGTMREKMPVNSSTLMIMMAQSGVCPRCV